MITTPNGPVRTQGESGVAARLVPVTADGLILAAPEADRMSVGAALLRFARGHYANRSQASLTTSAMTTHRKTTRMNRLPRLSAK